MIGLSIGYMYLLLSVRKIGTHLCDVIGKSRLVFLRPCPLIVREALLPKNAAFTGVM